MNELKNLSLFLQWWPYIAVGAAAGFGVVMVYVFRRLDRLQAQLDRIEWRLLSPQEQAARASAQPPQTPHPGGGR